MISCDTLKTIQQRDSGHAGGLFLSTFLFQKPRFPHVDHGFGTRSEEERGGGDCQALHNLVQCLPDWFLLIHLTRSHKMTVLFLRNTADITFTYKPFRVVLPEWMQKQLWIKSELFCVPIQVILPMNGSVASIQSVMHSDRRTSHYR